MLRFGLETGGEWLIDFALRSTVVFCTALFLTAGMRRHTASARHLVWVTAIMGVIGMPAMQLIVPAWRILPSKDAQADRDFSTASGMATLVQKDDLNAAPSSGFSSQTTSKSLNVPTFDAVPAESEQPELQSIPSTDVTSSGIPSAVVNSQLMSIGLAWQTIRRFMVVVWIVGVFMCCLPVMLGSVSVWMLRRSNQPVPQSLIDEVLQLAKVIHLSRYVSIVLSASRDMPMTWGLFRPVILLPVSATSWSPQRRRMVLLHELAHIQRWDCLTQLLGQMARAMHWFSPFAWLALHQLRIEQECACDDLVLNFGADAEDYASELLSITAGSSRVNWDTAVALAMSRATRMEYRLQAILDSGRERRPMMLKRFLLTIGLMSAVAIGTASLRSRSVDAAPPNAIQSGTQVHEDSPDPVTEVQLQSVLPAVGGTDESQAKPIIDGASPVAQVEATSEATPAELPAQSAVAEKLDHASNAAPSRLNERRPETALEHLTSGLAAATTKKERGNLLDKRWESIKSAVAHAHVVFDTSFFLTMTYWSGGGRWPSNTLSIDGDLSKPIVHLKEQVDPPEKLTAEPEKDADVPIDVPVVAPRRPRSKYLLVRLVEILASSSASPRLTIIKGDCLADVTLSDYASIHIYGDLTHKLSVRGQSEIVIGGSVKKSAVIETDGIARIFVGGDILGEVRNRGSAKLWIQGDLCGDVTTGQPSAQIHVTGDFLGSIRPNQGMGALFGLTVDGFAPNASLDEISNSNYTRFNATIGESDAEPGIYPRPNVLLGGELLRRLQVGRKLGQTWVIHKAAEKRD